mmetsp:Transcript_22128/g.68132  ORF Transcript_22128/g.68132 Transcript_22128/m.68132 type:complete len:134 (+) Transcript_22128:2708-3109(+)
MFVRVKKLPHTNPYSAPFLQSPPAVGTIVGLWSLPFLAFGVALRERRKRATTNEMLCSGAQSTVSDGAPFRNRENGGDDDEDESDDVPALVDNTNSDGSSIVGMNDKDPDTNGGAALLPTIHHASHRPHKCNV